EPVVALEADIAAGQGGQQDDHTDDAAADDEDAGAEAELGEDGADLLAVVPDGQRDVAQHLPPEQQLLTRLLEGAEDVTRAEAAGHGLAHIAPPLAAV